VRTGPRRTGRVTGREPGVEALGPAEKWAPISAELLSGPGQARGRAFDHPLWRETQRHGRPLADLAM
jgi:hypothetical protein